MNKSIFCAAAALGLGVVSVCMPARSNVLVFDPSIAIDQRFDDNYYLLPSGGGSLSATRFVGDVGLSRISEVALIEGRARADALVTTENDVGDEDPDYNFLLELDTKLRSQRASYGLAFSLTWDTPSRDIAADLSETGSLASDTGLNVTQSLSSNVARLEGVVKPNYQYDITRRLAFDTNATFTAVKHALPSAQDAVYQRYLEVNETPTLTYNEVTINDVGVFSPSGELDDFIEGKAELGFRYKLTPISTFSLTSSYSHFIAEVEPDPSVIVPFEQLIADDDIPEIRRKPRRESIATTTTFKLGYERFLQPNLQLTLIGGAYTNTTDNTDTLRPGEGRPDTDRSTLETDTDGWLASAGLTYDSGRTRYTGKLAIDVQPSSSGAQVETQELTGELFRILSPRTSFSFRARAYEPDRLGALAEDRFARRFISFEPKLQWRFSRNWTLISSYRYRRQKARVDPESAESNAVLLSVKFSPPSEIRDIAQGRGQ